MIRILLTITIIVVLKISVFGQKQYFTEPRKEAYLEALWQADVHHEWWGDSSKRHILIMVRFEDSIVRRIQSDMASFGLAIMALYRDFVLKSEHHRADSATVAIYKDSDSSSPVFTASIVYSKLNWDHTTSKAMSQALMMLCPDAKYSFSFDNTLFETFETKLDFEANHDDCMRFLNLIAAITAKYLWPDRSDLRKIVMVMIGPDGVPHPMGFDLDAKAFLEPMKNL